MRAAIYFEFISYNRQVYNYIYPRPSQKNSSQQSPSIQGSVVSLCGKQVIGLRAPGLVRGHEPGLERGHEPGLERGHEPGLERGHEPGLERGDCY